MIIVQKKEFSKLKKDDTWDTLDVYVSALHEKAKLIYKDKEDFFYYLYDILALPSNNIFISFHLYIGFIMDKHNLLGEYGYLKNNHLIHYTDMANTVIGELYINNVAIDDINENMLSKIILKEVLLT